MIENGKKLNEEELAAVNGGYDEEEEKRKKEASLHGKIARDMFGNVTFTDKTGQIGTFTADQWNTLRKNWDYTGNPEYYMETINVNELKGVLGIS